MKKPVLILIALVVFSSHDMYLKLDTYFLQPNASAAIRLFNGTFDKSDNVIARDRMIDVSLVGNGSRTRVDTAQWIEKDSMTILSFTTGEAGTWVAGVSTRPRNIEMTAEDFNGYLEHDGVLDMLEWRKENDALNQDAVEKYSKHVKTIFQVGDKKTEDWRSPLGYPIEFIPQENPYDMHPGHALRIQLLWQGQPLANQLVYVGTTAEQGQTHDHEHADAADHEHSDDHTHAAGSEHSHEHEHAATDHEHGEDHSHAHADEDAHEHPHDQAEEAEVDHHHHAATQLRTDAEGMISVNITAMGIWYLRTIHLVQSEEAGLTHESNWATLTFEVGEGHSHDEDHAHTNDHDHGIPSYVYWVGSLLLLGGLFFWFNRKK